MPLYQEFRRRELATELSKAGELRVWPLLESRDQSLDHQPAVHALARALQQHQHILLVGPAGSGKTILSLYLSVAARSDQIAYLEAQRWAPSLDADLLTQFLTVAGCDVAAGQQMLDGGRLTLILDAIDEAPWRAGGASLPEAVTRLAKQIEGKAGLLVTSRLSAYLPDLDSPSVEARLTGIRSDEIEQFLSTYIQDRSTISVLIEKLHKSSFPDDVKYSPLVLRLLGEVVSDGNLYDNIIELFEFVSDRYIERECKKVLVQGTAPIPGTWQSCYSDPTKHRNFISGLLYAHSKSQQVMTEEQFKSAVMTLLSPDQLQARALVDLSTVMSQHPLVPVAWVPQGGVDYYKINYDHDWVRAALLPKFLSDAAFEAQIFASEGWHQTFPPPEDFCAAWRYMSSERTTELLANLLGLASSHDQYIFVCRWLLLQIFNNEFPLEHLNDAFSTASKAAYRSIPANRNLIGDTGLEQFAVEQLELQKAYLMLADDDQLGNLAGVTLSECTIRLGPRYTSLLRLEDCILDRTEIIIEGPAELRIDRCYLPDVKINSAVGAQVVISDSVYDPAHCQFQESTRLVDCRKTSIRNEIFNAYALATILKRFVVVNPTKPEASLKKANIAEDNVYKGITKRFSVTAHSIVDALVAERFLDTVPTGGVKRYSPTANFDANEATRFLMHPVPGGTGEMTQRVLRRMG